MDERQRSQPRFPLGEQLIVLLDRQGAWREFSAFTVNVSENGVLVTLPETPEVGEFVRVRLPAESFEGEAVVVYVIPGNSKSHLVGMRLRHKRGQWLASRASP